MGRHQKGLPCLWTFLTSSAGHPVFSMCFHIGLGYLLSRPLKRTVSGVQLLAYVMWVLDIGATIDQVCMQQR